MQAAPHHLHVPAVVAHADVLEHADRIRVIELLALLAVVLQADRHWQMLPAATRVCGLLLCNGDAYAGHAVALGRELEGAAPAASHVEHPLRGADTQLAEYQRELGFLRLIERV